MKKFLFTLATLVAFGFAANAGDENHSIELRLNGPSNYNAETQELTMTPSASTASGRRATFHFNANIVGSVSGIQIGYVITDPEGNIIPDDGPVHIRALGGLYFRPETSGPSALPGNAYGNNYYAPEGMYRLVGANLTYGVVWITEPDLVSYFGEDYEEELGLTPEYYTYPANVIQFQIEVDPSWDGEYVNVTCDRDYYKFAWIDGYQERPYEFFDEYSFKVVNADYVSTKDFTGEIIFGELDETTGNIPVSYNGPEEVTFTVTIDGVEVEITDGMINLGEYGDHTVVVTISAEGYNSVSRTKVFTWAEPVVEQTAAPEVNFEMRGDVLWCVITGEGDIYVDGQNCGPAPYEFVVTTQTTVDQEGSYMIYAIADGKTQSETVVAAWECPAKVVEYAEKPVITYDEETFTVTATSADQVHMFIDGVEVEGNTYTFEQTAEDVTYHVTAYASAEGKENSEYAEKEITVPAKVVEYTAVPVVNVEITDDAYIFTATGDGEVVLYVDGVEVENPYTVARPETAPEEPYAVYVYATAQEEGKEMSSSDVQRVVIEPKEAVQPVVTPTPNIVVTETEDAYIITVEGEGELHLYVNGEEVEIPCTIAKGDEDVTYYITATAQVEGQEVSVPCESEVVVPAKPQPQVTPVPQIVVTPDADNQGYTIQAVGEGEVHLYINGEEVDNPYHVDRTESNIELNVRATAQADGMEMSEATQMVVIPAFEGEGYFIVLVDQDGVEHTYPLHPSANNPNNYVNMFTLEFNPWGSFDYNHGEPRPNVPFYFIVNGERLGAVEEYQAAAMGELEYTLQNPLFANNNYYTVPVGYTYTIGIQILPETGDMYVLVAQGGRVGVDELQAGKEVAGVRYFNMAGQEMQEAAGICIAVTTYTDGTTSTVKVIK